MDERLEHALELSKFRYTQTIEKRRLQEKLKADLTLPYGGTRFYIDRNFIQFLNTVTPDEGTGSIVILDDKLTPVRIDDVAKFRKDVIDIYTQVTNQYYIDFESLRRKRSTKDVVGL